MSNEHIDSQLEALSERVTELFRLGQYVQAKELAILACELEKRYHGEKHPYFAISLNNLAQAYKALGNYIDAESLMKAAIDILYTAYGESHPDYATSINNLGMLYLSIGNYNAAKPLLERALGIRERILGADDPKYAESLNNLAVLYMRICDYPTAKALFQKTNHILKETVGEIDSAFIKNLNNQACVDRYMGDFISAARLYEQSLDVLRKIKWESSLLFAKISSNLALVYIVMDNYIEAERLLINSIDIHRRLLGEKHPDFAVRLNNLGELYYSMGDKDTAEPLFRQAIEIWLNSPKDNPGNLGKCLLNLVMVCASTNREADALNFLKQIISIQDQLIGQVFSIGSEKQRIIYLKHTYFILDILLSLIIKYPFIRTMDAIQSTFNLILRWKCISVEAFATQRDLVLGGKYPELKEPLNQLTMLRRQIAAKMLLGPDPDGIEEYKVSLTQWNLRKEQLESDLAIKIPEMNLEQKLKKVDCKAIAESLPGGTVLIEFIKSNMLDFNTTSFHENPWSSPHYLAFTLSINDADNISVIDLGDAEQIDILIASYIATLTGEDETIDSAQANRSLDHLRVELSKALVYPFSKKINDYKNIIIAADGNLLLLPFETLQMENDKLLIDNFIISYISVGRDILRFSKKIDDCLTNSVVIADPDFDLCCALKPGSSKVNDIFGNNTYCSGTKGIYFDRLDGTREEGKRIAEMLGVLPWLGHDALKSRIKSIHSPFVFHIATHGILLEDQRLAPKIELQCIGSQEGSLDGDLLSLMPDLYMENPLLRSGLALAGINTWLSEGNIPFEVEDGFLTAEDITGLDLLNTKLVTLSACETGLGKIYKGEGMFGLRRAFILAGAKTLIVSLWAVDDDKTQELMIDFYQRVLAGQNCVGALRDAKLSIKNNNPHPYYWGAFICLGDPR